MSKKKEIKPLHEKYSEYTSKELEEIKREVCIAHHCQFLSGKNQLSKATTVRVCNYLLMTDKRRDCMPDVCTHWKDKKITVKPSNPNNHLFDNKYT